MVSKLSGKRHRASGAGRSYNKFLSEMKKKENGQEYRDLRQVRLDVSRLPENKAARVNIEKRIARIMTLSPTIHYYQGFHDVARYCESPSQLETLALEQLRDFLSASIGPTLSIIGLIPELLATADPEGYGVKLPLLGDDSAHFALAPILTLFSHDCTGQEICEVIIRRVVDHGLPYVLYLFAALCITYREDILSVNDTDEIHSALQKMAGHLDTSNFTKISLLATDLHNSYPLKGLDRWKNISPYSVLRTGRITDRRRAIATLSKLEKSYGKSGTLMAKINLSKSRATMMHLFIAVSVVTIGYIWSRRQR